MNEAHRVTPILLWGMMGAGKSALAQYLCDDLGLRSIDLDTLVARTFGQSVSQLIQTRGIDWFRATEREQLLSVLDEHRFQVIALGGGTLLDPALREAVRGRAYLCTLTAHPHVLSQRVARQMGQRPLLIGSASEIESKLNELVEERQDAYLDADCVIDTTDLTVPQLAELIIPLFLSSEAA